jgi:hypothetical protein
VNIIWWKVKPWRYAVHNLPHCLFTPSLLGPNTFPNTTFSRFLKSCSCLTITDAVSHPRLSEPERKEKCVVNPVTPELNPSTQRCLTRFLLGILLLEPCI